jgi:hypothetical protein
MPDLFPDTAPSPADPLIGRVICMDRPCRCGTNIAVISAGRGPHAGALRCRNCDAHWQWLSRADYETTRALLAECDRLFGTPIEITYRLIKQRSQAMADAKEYDNSGLLFRNHDKETDKHPDYKGNLTIGGAEYWLSAWIKDGKRGKFMSLSVKPKEQRAAAVEEFNDEIPF